MGWAEIRSGVAAQTYESVMYAYLMLLDIESFCLERKILQNKLFETTDLDTIKRVVQTVDSNRVFRFTYKQSLKKMSTVIHAYYTFLKSYNQS